MKQNFERIEHLIVDGGSSDGTLDLVSSYPHLKLLRGPDGGIFDAMNKGIAASSGDWVYFLGADDYFVDENVLRDLLPAFDDSFDVIYGDVVSSRFGGRYDGPFDAIKIRKKNICHQAIFFRRHVFERIGVFDMTYKSHADWDHNMRWFLNDNISRKYVDRVIAVYADGGFSSVNPDLMFQRDRLFRYLTYGGDSIPAVLYFALWCKELALGLRHWDPGRVSRAVNIWRGA